MYHDEDKSVYYPNDVFPFLIYFFRIFESLEENNEEENNAIKHLQRQL
jgi:hypothetical protein